MGARTTKTNSLSSLSISCENQQREAIENREIAYVAYLCTHFCDSNILTFPWRYQGLRFSRWAGRYDDEQEGSLPMFRGMRIA